MLDVNLSFIWIFFLIWFLYLILNRIYFKPIHAIITERETKIAADSSRQQNLLTEIETQTQVIESRLSQAQKEARGIKEEWLKNGEEIRSQAVAAAREQATRILDEKITELESEILAAELTLEKQISAFSETIKKAYL
jgi:F0F1-type ATP synthase membrane subunit b/b'